ncbi:MAG: C25 family cysteine peptidase [Candidatus Omnitrophica bacterium]|nr:C25 family cysteine peptidase [Candidatus Omnitrophota bacterium]
MVSAIGALLFLGSATSAFGSGITIPQNSSLNVNTGTLNAAGDISNAGALVLTTGTITLTGNWSNTGAFTAGSGTVNFTAGSGTQTLDSGGTGTGKLFYHLTHSGAGTLQLVNNDIDIDGNFTNSAGTFDANDLDIFCAGDWAKTGGTFTAGTGTVTFDGAGTQTISGANTWYNLVVKASGNRTVQFQSSVAQSITSSAGSLEFYADEGYTLTLAPETAATEWLLQLNSAITKQYVHNVSVSYSNAGPSGTYAEIKADDGTNTDGGNNTNWVFTPTAVRLAKFYALGYTNKVVVYWQTATEYKNAGFNLYRAPSKDGPFTKLNSSLIIGAGSTVTSRSYSFTDSAVKAGTTYFYLLEDVQTNGVKNRHGPVEAHPGLDTDNDGISDDWERCYGLNPSDHNDAALDLDSDDYTNLEEYLQETNPLVSDKDTEEEDTSAEGIKIISQDSAGITLELNTATFTSAAKSENGVVYNLLAIPGYSHNYTKEEGTFKLPTKTTLIGIPQNTQPVIRDISFEKEELRGYRVLPAPRLSVRQIAAQGAIEPIKTLKESFVPQESAAYPDADYPAQIVQINAVSSLRDQRVALLSFYPLTYNPVSGLLNFYKRIRVKINFQTDILSDENNALRELQEYYTSSPRLKIYTRGEGLYKLDYGNIYNAGFYDIVWLDPQTIKLYHHGREIPIYIKGEEDGWFNSDDYIVFYAPTFNSIYSARDCYILEYGGINLGLRMEEVTPPTAEARVFPSAYSYTLHAEENQDYWPEAAGPDDTTDHWFSLNYIFNDAQTDFTLQTNNLSADSSYEASLKIKLWSCLEIPQNHHIQVLLNGYELTQKDWEGRTFQVIETKFPASYLIEGENTVSFNLALDTGEEFDLVLVDYIELCYKKRFSAEENKITFDYSSSELCEFAIPNFTLSDISLYAVSDETSVQRFTGLIPAFNEVNNTYTLTFKDAPVNSKRYIALLQYNAPDSLAVDNPSDLKRLSNQADLLIITAKDFIDTLQPLVELRQRQKLNVRVVDVEDIFDEFNHGVSSPHAIKDFLKYAYKNWKRPAPTYVLLVGDASYDYKDYYSLGRTNFVPTYLTYTQYFGQTGSDNWFVCLDEPQEINGLLQDDILPDMLIGRFPVRTSEELTNIIDKIIAYDTQGWADWQKNLLFIVDEDPQLSAPFLQASQDSIGLLSKNGGYLAAQIRLADYADIKEAKDEIKTNINNGSLWVQFTGHGAVKTWSSSYVFTDRDILELKNYGKYPFIESLTCMDGFYLHPFIYECMAEVFLKQKERGAVAYWSSTGMTDTEGQLAMNKGLFEAVFVDKNTNLGSATTQAKVYSYSINGAYRNDWISTWTLFGDPSLNLKIKKKKPRKKKPAEAPALTGARPRGIVVSETSDSPAISNFDQLLKTAIINFPAAKAWRDFDKRPEDTYEPVPND